MVAEGSRSKGGPKVRSRRRKPASWMEAVRRKFQNNLNVKQAQKVGWHTQDFTINANEGRGGYSDSKRT